MKKGAPNKENNPHQPKFIIALNHLMERPLNELEALNLYGETCLHSTISTLWNTHNLGFHRIREPHIHQGGGKTHFMRYTLKPEHRARATILLKRYGGD